MDHQECYIAEVMQLQQLVEYVADTIVSKPLLESEAGNITLFSFDQGQGLSEHTVPFDAMIQVLQGEVDVHIGENPLYLLQGDCIIMPANIPHKLYAVRPFKMLLTLLKG